MAPRTDVHRPAELVTEDYEFEGAYYLGSSDSPSYYNASCVGVHTTDTVPYWGGYWNEEQDRCDHCGARLLYGAVLYHKPSNSHIHVGETCLANRFERATAEFQRLRKQAELDRQAAKIREAWNFYKAAHTDVDWDALAASQNTFVQDVLRKGRLYGGLSERQLEGVQKALVRDAEYAAKKAALAAAAPEILAQVPDGKGFVLNGEVLSTKCQDSQFGTVLKMLVKVSTPEGSYKVWGTVPSNIYPHSGDKICFTANLLRSLDDPSFGFFSRPRKASITEVVAS